MYVVLIIMSYTATVPVVAVVWVFSSWNFFSFAICERLLVIDLHFCFNSWIALHRQDLLLDTIQRGVVSKLWV